MKQQQLQEVKEIHRKLRNLGEISAPTLTPYLITALCSGKTLKLRPADAVTEAARTEIANASGYINRRELEFSKVFASTPEFDREIARWKAYDTKRKAALASYGKESEKIMVRALDPASDAVQIMEELHAAAEASGLTALKFTRE